MSKSEVIYLLKFLAFMFLPMMLIFWGVDYVFEMIWGEAHIQPSTNVEIYFHPIQKSMLIVSLVSIVGLWSKNRRSPLLKPDEAGLNRGLLLFNMQLYWAVYIILQISFKAIILYIFNELEITMNFFNDILFNFVLIVIISTIHFVKKAKSLGI